MTEQTSLGLPVYITHDIRVAQVTPPQTESGLFTVNYKGATNF